MIHYCSVGDIYSGSYNNEVNSVPSSTSKPVEVAMYSPSETFQLVHEAEIRPYKAELIKPEQSNTFKSLEKKLG